MALDKFDEKKLNDEQLEQVNGGLNLRRDTANKDEELGVFPVMSSLQDKAETGKAKADALGSRPPDPNAIYNSGII